MRTDKQFKTLDDVKQLVTAIKQGDLKPIYFLMGEEAYYIDRISDFIEDNVLDEAEKGCCNKLDLNFIVYQNLSFYVS